MAAAGEETRASGLRRGITNDTKIANFTNGVSLVQAWLLEVARYSAGEGAGMAGGVDRGGVGGIEQQ